MAKSSYKDSLDKFNANLLPLLERHIDETAQRRREECEQDGSIDREFGVGWIYKTRKGSKTTGIRTQYGVAHISCVQIQLRTGARRDITRWLLGISRRARIPDETQHFLAGFVVHARYRAAQELSKQATNGRVSTQTLHKFVRKLAAKVKPTEQKESTDKIPIYELDGTGAHITGESGSKSEIKYIGRRTPDGLQWSDVWVGASGAGWNKQLENIFKANPRPLLVMDGDHGVRRALRALMAKNPQYKPYIQYCHWHIRGGLVYAINTDRRKHGCKETKEEILSQTNDVIVALKTRTWTPDIIERRLAELSRAYRKKGYASIAAFFAYLSKTATTCQRLKIRNATISTTERTMRTIGDRIKRGKWWKHQGAQDMARLRLAWYQSGWRPDM